MLNEAGCVRICLATSVVISAKAAITEPIDRPQPIDFIVACVLIAINPELIVFRTEPDDLFILPDGSNRSINCLEDPNVIVFGNGPEDLAKFNLGNVSVALRHLNKMLDVSIFPDDFVALRHVPPTQAAVVAWFRSVNTIVPGTDLNKLLFRIGDSVIGRLVPAIRTGIPALDAAPAESYGVTGRKAFVARTWVNGLRVGDKVCRAFRSWPSSEIVRVDTAGAHLRHTGDNFEFFRSFEELERDYLPTLSKAFTDEVTAKVNRMQANAGFPLYAGGPRPPAEMPLLDTEGSSVPSGDSAIAVPPHDPTAPVTIEVFKHRADATQPNEDDRGDKLGLRNAPTVSTSNNTSSTSFTFTIEKEHDHAVSQVEPERPDRVPVRQGWSDRAVDAGPVPQGQ